MFFSKIHEKSLGHLPLVRNFEELFEFADSLHNYVFLTLGVPAYKGVRSIFEEKVSEENLKGTRIMYSL